MKILKFGGKSLADNKAIAQVTQILQKKKADNETFAIVVSARGNTTDDLLVLLQKAAQGLTYKPEWLAFASYQSEGVQPDLLQPELAEIENILKGVALIGDYSDKVTYKVVALGEVMAAKYLAWVLTQQGINAKAADTRKLLITDSVYAEAHPLEEISKANFKQYFAENNSVINVFTGYIAANAKGETTTLGRNGSNYSAALIANFIGAEAMENYTHVDGIFTANPELIPDAKKIDTLSFAEANELANLGANVLHAKTILPLAEKNIPLKILNTFNPEKSGTWVTQTSSNQGIKALSVLENVSLITLEGTGLLGKVGVDARIFSVLAKANISVSIISQGSSERGIAFVINTDRANEAVELLTQEFETDRLEKDIHKIYKNDEVAVISIVGQSVNDFYKPYTSLIKNNIVPLLINNTSTGKNIGLVVREADYQRAVHVIHGEIFGVSKKINIALLGHGTVGGTLIEQLLSESEKIESQKGIKLSIFAVANSQKVLFNPNGIDRNWLTHLQNNGIPYTTEDITDYAQKHHLENLILVDNTASPKVVESYITFVSKGFNIVSSNKIANTLSYSFYKNLREVLHENQKEYLYETNVGAGLPLIDTIKLLHLSGENITQIKGVFSGSLSYVFNTFSAQDVPFSEVLQQAVAKGYTEPDPREDLCGNDVARKLLILARELDLENEFSDIEIQNLIPEVLQKVTLSDFFENITQCNPVYGKLKEALPSDKVLRYVGELSGDLQLQKGNLSVRLVEVPKNSALGQLKGSDSLFEIYTESYGNNPIVIQGAGAGASVTARGVFGDILRIAGKV